MPSRFHQGTFLMKHPEKYVGNKAPYFRSGWEWSVMSTFDSHLSILHWSSESLEIPYYDPLMQKMRKYIPDFLIEYIDSSGVKHVELIEVKPASQTGQKKTRSKKNQEQIIINTAKWESARDYCSKNGIGFRILTENEIFGKKK
jgi:hypothetical protein